jgi:5'-nucleotidase
MPASAVITPPKLHHAKGHDPAHERVIRTLRRWNVLFDEVHFIGCRAKAPFLAACGAHIYFDDRKAHVEAASRLVPAGRVPELPSPQRQ